MMDKHTYKKYTRMNDRLTELSELNTNIGRLAFYLRETANDYSGEELRLLHNQLDCMSEYRDLLEERIILGVF